MPHISISQKFDIIDVNNYEVIVYASDDEINELNELGFKPIIQNEVIEEKYGLRYSTEALLNFHDYESLTTELNEIVLLHPNITNLYEIVYTSKITSRRIV